MELVKRPVGNLEYNSVFIAISTMNCWCAITWEFVENANSINVPKIRGHVFELGK